MSNRIYFSLSIEELEELYRINPNDLNILKSLKEELLNRKTKRARSLLDIVKKIISNSDDQSAPVLNNTPEIDKASSADIEKPFSQVTIDPSEAPNEIAIQLIDWDHEFESFEKNNQTQIATNVPRKKVENKPDDLLSTWTVIEALSPQSYLKPRDLIIGKGDVAPISKGYLPWPLDKSKPNCRLFYTIYLGALDLSACTKDLLDVYQDIREEQQNVSGKAALAVVIVDKNGKPLGIDYSAISSFGWAYSRALSGDLSDLKYWDFAEKKLLEDLDKMLQRHDEDGNLLPLTWGVINQAYDWLVKNCAIPKRVMSAPEFAIKRFAPFSIGTPEAPLLNSFYLSDLQTAKSLVKEGHAGSALRKYLGIYDLKNKHDLFEDNDQLKEILQPKNIPLGRWPVKGKHSLVLLQQVAVNLAKRDLKDEGLFSVNGPPGTGKTTLLRDVVADVIVDRAIAMAAFNKPAEAFTKTNDVISSQGNKFHIHKIHESLKGHEILIASSNNKAVENISKELPLTDAIDDSVDLNYFKPLSDSLLSDTEESWGLIATVLGNSTNKSKFVDKAWWNKDTSLQSYFEYISGSLDCDEDDEGNEIIPSIVEFGSPPRNLHDAIDNWNLIKKQFEEALNKVRSIKKITQEALECENFLNDYALQRGELANQSELLIEKLLFVDNSLEALKKDLELKLSNFEISDENLLEHEKHKLGFLKQIFLRSQSKAWQFKNLKLVNQKRTKHEEVLQVEILIKSKKKEYEDLQIKEIRIKSELQKLQEKVEESKVKIEAANKYCRHKLVTDETLNIPHDKKQNFNPIFTKEAHECRDQLFILSMNLHKAFIDAAYRPISQNFFAFMKVLGNKKLKNSELLPDVWSTGFIICPVFSTAFASIDRMLNVMPSQSIGWLLIDEAGQATPQQAVGAIMRSKRVMAVGDPLQIEPVVTTPLPLLEGISAFMGVNNHEWVAPDASVQTLADRANNYGALIDKGLSTLWIGSPLLVHRRCEDPMFTISNKLAYNQKMVKATLDQITEVSRVFGGHTNWFDIQGTGNDKWCPASGDFIVEKILKAAELKGESLDLFVISPFKVVAQKMRERMSQESNKLATLGINNPRDWISRNIGTVHTFQGKEAESVILLLGAPNVNQKGARNWAASSVNLMNVAVSRAKNNFYIVGNQSLWSEVGKMPLMLREIRRHLKNY